jgi:holin-like protein
MDPSEDLVRIEMAERQRLAERCVLAAAARPPRVPWRVRIGLGLIALGGRVMLGALVLLLLFQLAGEVTVRWLSLPLPGPVVGMLLLFAGLAARGGVPGRLRATGDGLLRHLMLLLVPSTTGLMLHLGRLGEEWLPIALAGIGGAACTLAVTPLTLRLLTRGKERAR